MFTIDNQFSNANTARTVRFPETIFEELNDAAGKNNVSFNLLILQCCRYALDHLDGLHKKNQMTKEDNP